MNYSLIQQTIKSGIKDSGFRYWEPHDWFDLEVGKLPEAAMQDGFTVRFVSQEPSQHGSDGLYLMTMDIEFALEARKDRYLARMSVAEAAVRALRGDLEEQEGVVALDDSIWPSFQMQYIGEIVVMTFTINFEV